MDGVGDRQEVSDLAQCSSRPEWPSRYRAGRIARTGGVLTREFSADHVVVCYPDQLARFVGKATRIVAVSTHNPLGTTLMEARLIVAKVAQRCHLSL